MMLAVAVRTAVCPLKLIGAELGFQPPKQASLTAAHSPGTQECTVVTFTGVCVDGTKAIFV